MSTVPEMRSLDRAEPVYMAEITLGGGMVLRLATRRVTYGLERYEDYLDEVRGIGGLIERASPTGRDSGITLVFRNEPFESQQRLVFIGDEHPFEGSLCVVREAYLGPSGSLSDAVEVFRGVLDAPSSITGLRFTCEASTAEYSRDRKI